VTADKLNGARVGTCTLDVGIERRRNDANAGPRGDQRVKLGRGDTSAPDEHHVSSVQVQKDGQQALHSLKNKKPGKHWAFRAIGLFKPLIRSVVSTVATRQTVALARWAMQQQQSGEPTDTTA